MSDDGATCPRQAWFGSLCGPVVLWRRRLNHPGSDDLLCAVMGVAPGAFLLALVVGTSSRGWRALDCVSGGLDALVADAARFDDLAAHFRPARVCDDMAPASDLWELCSLMRAIASRAPRCVAVRPQAQRGTPPTRPRR
jgi:hypothetical protein